MSKEITELICNQSIFQSKLHNGRNKSLKQLCELFRERGASIPDSDWTANATNSGGEPTTKRQRFQFGIDELKMLVIIILLPNLVRFLSKASPGDFVNGPFGCS